MRIGDCLLQQIESDLGINIRYSKGQAEIPVENCWHFSTDGNAVDTLFWSDGDFKDGMNRMALLKGAFNVVVLAFALMDNHVHFSCMVTEANVTNISMSLSEGLPYTSQGIMEKDTNSRVFQ